jgi:hypothetical protein
MDGTDTATRKAVLRPVAAIGIENQTDVAAIVRAGQLPEIDPPGGRRKGTKSETALGSLE